MWRGPAWLTITRDVTFLVIGAAGVVWQGFVVPKPSAVLIGVFALVMAGPGIFATVWLAQSGTGSPSPPPPLPPPSPSSSPPSSPAGTGG